MADVHLVTPLSGSLCGPTMHAHHSQIPVSTVRFLTNYRRPKPRQRIMQSNVWGSVLPVRVSILLLCRVKRKASAGPIVFAQWDQETDGKGRPREDFGRHPWDSSWQSASSSGRDQGVVLVADRSASAKTVESIGVDAVPQSGYIGTPLLWFGAGVATTTVFIWVAERVKKYAMQQMLKTMMSQASQGNQFSGLGGLGGFSGMPSPPGASFGFPPMPPSASPLVPTVAATAASAAPPVDILPISSSKSKTNSNSVATSTPAEAKKSGFAFTDVNEELVLEQQEAALRAAKDRESAPYTQEEQKPLNRPQSSEGPGYRIPNIDGGAFPNGNFDGKNGQIFTVEALERMMEDPTVQKMVYPYLPEEMRNPTTFKWMMQNPQYRQQLQDMLNSMGGDGAWDSRMSDMLKNFDLNSQEVKQQFDQIGLTPEEVVAKIMANPEVAVAFQNPKVQVAIMDCSQNPLNISKYQNDKEVMEVFNKITELFPGMTGSAY